MPSLITNVSGNPITLPLQPACVLPAGNRVIYAGMEPADIIAALSGGAAVAALGLDIAPIDASKAPGDVGLCPTLYATKADIAGITGSYFQVTTGVGSLAAHKRRITVSVARADGVPVAAGTPVLLDFSSASVLVFSLIAGTQMGVGDTENNLVLLTDSTGKVVLDVTNPTSSEVTFLRASASAAIPTFNVLQF